MEKVSSAVLRSWGLWEERKLNDTQIGILHLNKNKHHICINFVPESIF